MWGAVPVHVAQRRSTKMIEIRFVKLLVAGVLGAGVWAAGSDEVLATDVVCAGSKTRQLCAVFDGNNYDGSWDCKKISKKEWSCEQVHASASSHSSHRSAT